MIVGFHALLVVLLSACAFNLADVEYAPTPFQAMTEAGHAFMLSTTVKLTDTPCWYGRELRQHTRWEYAGSVTQGEVFRSRDQILTLECSNIYEAYLVIRDAWLVGFFLPVQQGFVGLAEPVMLPVQP